MRGRPSDTYVSYGHGVRSMRSGVMHSCLKSKVEVSILQRKATSPICERGTQIPLLLILSKVTGNACMGLAALKLHSSAIGSGRRAFTLDRNRSNERCFALDWDRWAAYFDIFI